MAQIEKPLAQALGWRTLETSCVYECPWFRVRHDRISQPGAPEGAYTYVEHPGSVFVVPILPDGRILLIKSYRYTLDAWCWEVPAGTLADCPGASPEMVAKKELQEETGATCRELRNLGGFYLGNGFANHLAHFFLAIDVEQSSKPVPEAFEHIAEAVPFSLDEITDFISGGSVIDG